jgi:hypothetical protein
MSSEGRTKELTLVCCGALLETVFWAVTRTGGIGLEFQSAFAASPASRPNHLRGAMSAAYAVPPLRLDRGLDVCVSSRCLTKSGPGILGGRVWKAVSLFSK